MPSALAPDPFRVRYLRSAGFFSMACVRWGVGGAEKPDLVCVHGLTRQGRDFDWLARALARNRRVICPDMPGRGLSDWLPEAVDYNMAGYMGDLSCLLSGLGDGPVDWVGTSMGGILGMMLAGMPNTPIRRLVLNDIGGVVSGVGLARIGQYLGAHRFPSLKELEAALRRDMAGFGALPPPIWQALARHSAREPIDGHWHLAYDPALAEAFHATPPGDVDLWPVYERVTCPVLLLRGVDSDILSAEIAAEMTQRGPRARLFEVPETGHAPSLTTESQIAQIREFLDSDCP